jgi:hypothetical protein
LFWYRNLSNKYVPHTTWLNSFSRKRCLPASFSGLIYRGKGANEAMHARSHVTYSNQSDCFNFFAVISVMYRALTRQPVNPQPARQMSTRHPPGTFFSFGLFGLESVCPCDLIERVTMDRRCCSKPPKTKRNLKIKD